MSLSRSSAGATRGRRGGGGLLPQPPTPSPAPPSPAHPTPPHPLTRPPLKPPTPSPPHPLLQAYKLMWELKELFDPEYVLNPGVVLNRDPDAHIKFLKPSPVASPIVNRCGRGCGRGACVGGRECEPPLPFRYRMEHIAWSIFLDSIDVIKLVSWSFPACVFALFCSCVVNELLDSNIDPAVCSNESRPTLSHTSTPFTSPSRCIECGFCESNCPSRDVTLTPRQRIAVFRELNRLQQLTGPTAQEKTRCEGCGRTGGGLPGCKCGQGVGRVVRYLFHVLSSMSAFPVLSSMMLIVTPPCTAPPPSQALRHDKQV